MEFDKIYYMSNNQLNDRISLYFYYRLASAYVKSGNVLDFGCGSGHLIKRFKSTSYRTHAYDISPHALQLVKNNSPATAVHSDLHSLTTTSMDLIISVHVLEHLENPFDSLRFFYTMLNKNGILIFVVPNISGFGHKIKGSKWFGYGDKSHISLFESSKWLNMTITAGFTILETGTDGLWDVPYISYVPAWMQKILFYPLPALQIFTGRLFLPSNSGESLIVVAQKP